MILMNHMWHGNTVMQRIGETSLAAAAAAIPDGAISSDAAAKDIEMRDENQEKKRRGSFEVETIHDSDDDL